MVFSDGECPNCGHPNLSLNTSDLLECQQCHMVCANIDGLVATVMPFLGEGSFRFEDCDMSSFSGTAFAKALTASVLPDLKAIFQTRAELRAYLSQLPTSKSRQTSAEALWGRFQAVFKTRILATTLESFVVAWSTNTERTRFCERDLMSRVASALGLIHGKEEFTVDYVMSRTSVQGISVPQVFVESENAFNSASHEISKLCSLNAPLRVLITARDGWVEVRAESKGHGKLREWQSVVRAHAEQNENYTGVLGVIVGSRIGLRVLFRACAFRSDGNVLTPLFTLAEASTD
jgi:hypothetical protein